VNEQGKRRSRTTLELVFLALRNLALSGNPRAIKVYWRYLAKYQPPPGQQGGYVLAPAPLSIEESPFPVEYVKEEEQ